MFFSIHQKRMQQIMTHCFFAVKSKLDRRLGFFDLIGCDFMVDTDFKVREEFELYYISESVSVPVQGLWSKCVFMDLNRSGCWR